MNPAAEAHRTILVGCTGASPCMVLATSHAALVSSMQLASSARRAIVVCDPGGTVWLVAAAWAAALCGRLEAYELLQITICHDAVALE
eukprot:CAMPEP_0177557922 /NCGR_PEP_ID=MMETSP0369-20130122/69957_1 /TAXON_ID=447022 ORGANISM="Scrippsiella hangoei-like, Strain SHHI-4" /NCGR_SAMPLE_ID=MMETSP0369 /ASSEMBLY_ACC=CAM_ASM_000364 /LENGTH=87 /DNA_ID=CAMNT_0019044409 /DNA_START=150 /DNA_END=410 /DNA_ORIENTATION=-